MNNNTETFETKKVVIEYRAYYNPVTKHILKIVTVENGIVNNPDGITEDLEFIVVDRSQIFLDTMNHIVSDGKVIPKPIPKIEDLKLSKTYEDAQFRTYKNNNIFLVDNNFKGETSSWKIKTNE